MPNNSMTSEPMPMRHSVISKMMKPKRIGIQFVNLPQLLEAGFVNYTVNSML